VSVDRLIDSKGSSTGAEAELIDLIEAYEPVCVSEMHKRRSLGAVYSRNHERRRRVRVAMRLAMASVVLLAAGAATAAAFGVHWTLRPTVTPLAVVATPVHHVARAARPTPEPAPAPAVAEEIAPPPPPAVHHARVVRSEDPTLVVSALQALRQDQDPDRAARLLAAYLHTHPRGALAEEAVALSIEAADARKSPAAVGFAHRYLKDYPQGRFRPVAERVLARTAL
jgi:hypothetical protein